MTRIGATKKREKTRSPVVCTRGDLNRLTLDVVLPEVAQVVAENQLRETIQERDKAQRFGASPEYWLAEVSPGVWETTTPLPHRMPPIRVHKREPLFGKDGVYWLYVGHLLRYKVCRTGEAARKLARETKFRTVTAVDLTAGVRL